MLDTHQLNVFLVAAETLNFSKAGLRLHMTQPSVTQHIQSLESHFGTRLFVRSGHHLSLTEAGASLLPLAREMVTLSIRTDEIMESLKGEVHGHLMVGCSTTPGKYVLPVILADFMQKYPRVRATCQVTSRKNALRMLSDGIVQLALASTFIDDRDMQFQKFISDRIVLITPLSHPWAEKRCIDLADLSNASFIMREEESGTYTVVREGLAARGYNIENFQKVLTLGNSEAIAMAVQEGIGVAFISQMVVDRIVHGKVAQVEVNGLELYQDIYLGHHWRHPATSAQLAFWNYVNDPQNPVILKLAAPNAVD
jgi:DNA-binding transcriptional LysR family regulator